MLTIARVTRRYKYGTKPHECVDNVEGYYTDIEKARKVVKEILGSKATPDNEFGFDCWLNPDFPKVEYYIDLIEVR